MKKTIFLSIVSFALVALAVLQFCVKPPDYPEEPVIEFIGISKNTMLQSNMPNVDSLALTFKYTDGDGDLGFPDEPKEADTVFSIFIRDSRDSFLRTFKLPYVEPQGASNGISGEISIILQTRCCTYVTPQGIPLACQNVPVMLDTFNYLITIRDRAGHISNEIQSSPITLICH